MARITHVKKAQQRYASVPVLDENGDPKRTPVMRNGVQKTTKHGRPVFMSVTREDRTQPKPPYVCDHCRKEIEVGTPYKHISPKSGPYGGRKLTRHESCPTWQVWEYSSSMSAELARISHEFDMALDAVESPDDVSSALEDAATAVRELAEQKREGAENIESGFGHPTSQSEELEQLADDLESWADDIEAADVPELPDIEERYFVTNGDGVVSDLFETDGYESEADAAHALDVHREDNGVSTDEDWAGDGLEVEAIEPDELTGEQLDEWRDEVRNTVTVLEEGPF